MNTAEKVRENRLRRMAKRRRLVLVKSRRRDPQAWDYGTYGLIDPARGAWVAQDVAIGEGYGLDLHAIEAWLTGEER